METPQKSFVVEDYRADPDLLVSVIRRHVLDCSGSSHLRNPLLFACNSHDRGGNLRGSRVPGSRHLLYETSVKGRKNDSADDCDHIRRLRRDAYDELLKRWFFSSGGRTIRFGNDAGYFLWRRFHPDRRYLALHCRTRSA